MNRKQRRAARTRETASTPAPPLPPLSPSHPTPQALLGEALARQRDGDLDGAEALCRRVLDRTPDMAAALGILGVLRMQRGDAAVGIGLLDRACATDPGDPQWPANLAMALASCGRLVAAETQARRALALDPAHAGGRAALARILRDQEKPPAADEARGLAEAELAQAVALHSSGQTETAVAQVQRLMARVPDLADGHWHLGGMLRALGRPEAAEEAFRTALRLRPEHPYCLADLAALLEGREQLDEAESLLRRALALRDDDARLWANLASLLWHRGRAPSCIVAANRALALDPDNRVALNNLGIALLQSGDVAGAERALRAVLAQIPDDPRTIQNLARIDLARGALDRGWAGYGARLAVDPEASARRWPMPRWNGMDPAGKRILVWREQGVGDEIMYAGLLPDLIARAGSVVVEADRRLVPLLARSFHGATVRPDGSGSTDADLELPIGELPRRFRRRLDDFLPVGGWLRVDGRLAERWRERLAALPQGLRVGIAWRSRLVTESRADAYTALADWVPLLRLPGVRAVNLQCGPVAAEIADVERDHDVVLHRWPDLDLTDDLEGLAALIAGLDLVVSVGTMVAELAGAVGTPCWRLTAPREWTLLGTAVRPWFPSQRPILPPPGLPLAGAIPRVVAELRRLAPAADPALLLQAAVACHQRGDAAAAEAGYRAVLAADPDQPDALSLLGALLTADGRAATAVPLAGRAAALRPDRADFQSHLGNALHQAGNRDGAAARYVEALRLDPGHADAATNLGAIRLAEGAAAEAVALHRRAIAAEPDHATAWHNLAVALAAAAGDGQGAVGNAVAAAERACALAPGVPTHWLTLGVLSTAAGRAAEAAIALDRGLASLPQPSGPLAARLLTAKGTALEVLGREGEALDHHRRAREADPSLPEAAFNLGNALKGAGRPAAAAEAYEAALALRPDFAEAVANLAQVRLQLGQSEAAAVLYDRAVAAGAGAEARFGRGVLRLGRGNLAGGWADYAARFEGRLARHRRSFPVPPWRGEPLAGRHLLVWREQGLGDEIMFFTCLPDLAARLAGPEGEGGRATVACDRRLVGLLGRANPGLRFIADTDAVPGDIDLEASAGSLPGLLRPDLRAFDTGPPALVPDPALVARWRERLAGLPAGLRVGLSWRSGLGGRDRNAAYTALADWVPVLTLPGLVPILLQYDADPDEIATVERELGVTLHRWPDLDLKDALEDVAALVAGLDLVVSVATAVGELGAALGVPVWRLGQREDWTRLGTDVRPWYPAMRVLTAGAGQPVASLLGPVVADLRRLMPRV